MTDLQFVQLAAALLATLTPWIVVRVAAAVASRHAAEAGQPLAAIRQTATLNRMTIAALVCVAVIGVIPATRGMSTLAAGVGSFVLLTIPGLGALRAIEIASQPAREVNARIRSATLRPRRTSQFVSRISRGIPYAIGCALAVASDLTRQRHAAPGPRL